MELVAAKYKTPPVEREPPLPVHAPTSKFEPLKVKLLSPLILTVSANPVAVLVVRPRTKFADALLTVKAPVPEMFTLVWRLAFELLVKPKVRPPVPLTVNVVPLPVLPMTRFW